MESKDSNNPQVKPISHLEALFALIEALLIRSAFFSTSLLSESLQRLELASGCLLLRALAQSIAHIRSDDSLIHAVSLVEAIMDAHFLPLAMHAPSDENVRRALFALVESVRDAEGSLSALENALGMWTQIERIVFSHGAHVKPTLGVYQIEKLVL